MAFHSYTHLIQKLFNAYWCGPPFRVTGTSSWTCVDHLVSRLPPLTQRPVQARFHCGYGHPCPQPCQRWQLVGSLCKRHAVTSCDASTACRRMVSGSISLPSSGFFSPFPHGTGSLSVSQEYLALPDGPGGFAQNSSCSALLRIPVCLKCVRLRDCHPLWSDFPKMFFSAFKYNVPVLQPRKRLATSPVWAVPRSLATTWGIISLFSFPRGTKMFQFPRLAPAQSAGERSSTAQVVPFGNPRIKGHLHLPEAYRSLSRPSSPL